MWFVVKLQAIIVTPQAIPLDNSLIFILSIVADSPSSVNQILGQINDSKLASFPLIS